MDHAHAARLGTYQNHRGREEQQFILYGIVKRKQHGEQIETAIPVIGLTMIIPLPCSEDDKSIVVSFVDRRGETTLQVPAEIKHKETERGDSESIVFSVPFCGREFVVITPVPFEDADDDQIPSYVKRNSIRRNETNGRGDRE